MRLAERNPARLLALLLSLSLVTAACSDDDETETSTASPESEADGSETESGDATEAGGEASGTVDVSGSSTVEPISIAVAEAFADVEPGVTVNVDGPGTGDGFELFCQGEIAIADASRPIEAEEVTACEEGGVEFIELKIAFDGISVLTSPANAAVTCLSFEDLYALVGPESQGIDNWAGAQALATELGSTTELPDVPLEITAPGEESGTYDSFIEIAFGDVAEPRIEAGTITEEEAETTRPDYSANADDNVIIQGIEGSDSSLGWVGFAFAEEAGDAVKEIEVDGGEGCVAPSAETIADGSYPLSRPLFIYVNAAMADEDPAVSAYVDYYLSEEGIAAAEDVGYVALPEDQFAETTSAWESREVGTREA